MSSLATRARSHYRSQQKVALAGVRAARRAVMAASTQAEAQASLATTVATYQLASALNSAQTMAGEFGRTIATSPIEFAGTTQLGFPIETPIETIVDRLTVDLDRKLETLTRTMFATLDLFVASEIIAAGVDAAHVEITHENARYVRFLTPPSCDRCTILAGKIYRSEQAFKRHPGCNCEHWPVGSEAEARSSGLILNPDEAFERGEVRGLSIADAQAISDGADMAQVVNARRAGTRSPLGMTSALDVTMFGRTLKATTAGTTKRSTWRIKNPTLPIRLRPQSIYEHAKNREDAIRLLKLYGYL